MKDRTFLRSLRLTAAVAVLAAAACSVAADSTQSPRVIEPGPKPRAVEPIRPAKLEKAIDRGIAYLLALETVNDLEVTPEDNIEHDRYIENVYLGLKNGILDQSIILMSDRDHLTFLDCEEFEFAKYPTPTDNGRFEVLVAHSGLVTSLASNRS